MEHLHTGTYAARETSSGAATYAYRTLPAGSTELWAQGWVDVLSRSTSVNLFGYSDASWRAWGARQDAYRPGVRLRPRRGLGSKPR